MKRVKYGAEKVRVFDPKKTPHFHVNPKRRKIPEKSRVPKGDKEQIYGKERKRRAVNPEETEEAE